MLPTFRLFHSHDLPSCHFKLVILGPFSTMWISNLLDMFKIQQVRITKSDFLVMHHFSQSNDHVNAKCNAWMRVGCKDLVKYSFPNIFQKGTIHWFKSSITSLTQLYLSGQNIWLGQKNPKSNPKTLQTSRMRANHIVVAPLDHRLTESSSTLPLVYTSSISETCPCLGICWRFSFLKVVEYSFCSFNICFNSRIIW